VEPLAAIRGIRESAVHVRPRRIEVEPQRRARRAPRGHPVDDGGVAACYAGIATGMVVDRGTPTGPASMTGIVLRQTPPAGSPVSARGAVLLDVSKGAS